MSNRRYGKRWLSGYGSIKKDTNSNCPQDSAKGTDNNSNIGLYITAGFVVITLCAIVLGKSVNLRIENSVVKIDWSAWGPEATKLQNSK